MRRLLLGVPLLAGLLAACALQPAGTADLSEGQPDWLRAATPGTACRIPSGDGRIELAERGIGGTGPIRPQPAAPPAVPSETPPATGVAGVITGFGSVCLAGLEVNLAGDLAVTEDGARARPRLAAGERAILVARWQSGRPRTAAIALRHEIVGPVEAVLPGGGLRVAGQKVTLAAGAWVEAPLQPGAWVAVSGLPLPSGGVLASRIDAAKPGDVLLHGRLRRRGDLFMVGDLPVTGDGLAVLGGQAVTLRGLLADGRLVVTDAALDGLETDPTRLFGPGVSHYLLQAVVGGSARGAVAFSFATQPGVALPAEAVSAVIGLERAGEAGLVATAVSPSGTAAAGQTTAEPRQNAASAMPGRAPAGPGGGPGGGAGPGGGSAGGP